MSTGQILSILNQCMWFYLILVGNISWANTNMTDQAADIQNLPKKAKAASILSLCPCQYSSTMRGKILGIYV